MPWRGRRRDSGRGRRHGGGSRDRCRSRSRSSRDRSGYDGGRGSSVGNADQTEQKQYKIQEDPQAYFTGTASCREHLEAQNTNRTRYAATLSVMITNKIQVAQNACIRGLAMAWARSDKELADAFLTLRSEFGLVEVLRALNILDAGRQSRVLEKKLKRLQLSGAKVRPKKMGKLRSDIDNLNKLKPPQGSASGAVCKHVASWVRGFTAEELEFFAINFPKQPWMKLADICHLNPEKDFPSAPWYLPFCFGTGPPPDGSVVNEAHSLTRENVNEMVASYDIPYSVVKKFRKHLNAQSKKRIAEYEKKLDTVLWYYEDLACPETDGVLDARLAAGEPVNLPNGKLLERLLTILLMRNPKLNECRYGAKLSYDGEPEGVTNFFTRLIELAEPRLTSLKLNLESPIVVMGDASSSMAVAVRTSTIIASLLTAICSAKLVFFNNQTRNSPFLPKTVKEMLKLAATTLAHGGTTPASSLKPFYKKKEVVKTIIIVTDEEENGKRGRDDFASLYQKYHDEVYPAHLVFVSFLQHQHAQGQMVSALQSAGFFPKQLRLEGARPDLCKLDDMFAQLSAVTTTSFAEQLEAAEEDVRLKGALKHMTKVASTRCGKFQGAQSDK